MGNAQLLEVIDTCLHIAVSGTGLNHTSELATLGSIHARGAADGEVTHMHFIDHRIFTFLEGRTSSPALSQIGAAGIHDDVEVGVGLDHLAVGITSNHAANLELVGLEQLIAGDSDLIDIGVTTEIGHLGHGVILAIQVQHHIAVIW